MVALAPNIISDAVSPFCFPRDEISSSDFNVDAFVAKYKREVGLEKLRDDLDLFLRVLKSSMVELINRDYADFVNLSTNLVGLDKSITTLKNPLTNMRSDILKINETLQSQRQLIEVKLREQTEIRKRKQLIQSIIDVQKAIRKLHELDDAVNLNNIGITEMIERAVVQFGFISIELKKCGNEDIDSLKALIENLQRVFQERLSSAFINAYREQNMSLLADCLKGLACISLQNVAEQAFAQEIVRPYMEKTIRYILIQTTDILPALEKTLDFIQTECKAMLYVVERINRECGSHFDFVVNSIFPELSNCLEQSSHMIFFAGDPEMFHQRYQHWMRFIEQLDELLSKASEQRLKRSKQYQHFLNRWDLAVYYQIRFQEIASSIETVLAHEPLAVAPDGSKYRTLAVDTIFNSIDRCWQPNVYLEPLAHRFWKLTLQCMSRFHVWLESITTKKNSSDDNIKNLLNLYVDLESFYNEMKTYFQNVIVQKLSSLPSSSSSKFDQQLADVLEECLITIVEQRRTDLKSMVIRQLVNRCIETLHSVQDIPRLYRKTNREAPTKPSTCIIATFRHLKTFSDEFSGTILTYDECHKFLKLAIDDITKKYYDLCSDILSSVRKMEDSILLLKRVRETSSVKTSLVQNNPSVTVSDDNKIRMQITNDINAFTNELEKLGITSDSSNKLTLLITEEGRLQA